MPAVQSKVEEVFGKAPHKGVSRMRLLLLGCDQVRYLAVIRA